MANRGPNGDEPIRLLIAGPNERGRERARLSVAAAQREKEGDKRRGRRERTGRSGEPPGSARLGSLSLVAARLAREGEFRAPSHRVPRSDRKY